MVPGDARRAQASAAGETCPATSVGPGTPGGDSRAPEAGAQRAVGPLAARDFAAVCRRAHVAEEPAREWLVRSRARGPFAGSAPGGRGRSESGAVGGASGADVGRDLPEGTLA